TCNETHYIRADSLEQVVLLELNRMVGTRKRAWAVLRMEHRPSCFPYVGCCEAICAHPMGRVASMHLPAVETQCRPLCAPLWQGADCITVSKEKA
ncbi:MAG: hypothetical protein K2O11_03720, partial [Oscillospiraceae bacterium]|nr:hypothetical protein [Oscillospiraceae bacterium]